MHIAASDLFLWIVNPLLRAWLLWKLIRHDITPDLRSFRLYLGFYIFVDLAMMIFWLLNMPTCYGWGAWIGKTTAFILQMFVGVGIMKAVGKWKGILSAWPTWLVMVAGTVLMLYYDGFSVWASYSQAVEWCDVACVILVLSATLTPHKWKQPYNGLAVGLVVTVVLDLIVRLTIHHAPGPFLRMCLQASLTAGIMIWCWTVRPLSSASSELP